MCVCVRLGGGVERGGFGGERKIPNSFHHLVWYYYVLVLLLLFILKHFVLSQSPIIIIIIGQTLYLQLFTDS